MAGKPRIGIACCGDSILNEGMVLKLVDEFLAFDFKSFNPYLENRENPTSLGNFSLGMFIVIIFGPIMSST